MAESVCYRKGFKGRNSFQILLAPGCAPRGCEGSGGH